MPPLLPVWLCRVIILNKKQKKTYFIITDWNPVHGNLGHVILVTMLWSYSLNFMHMLNLYLFCSKVSNHKHENCSSCRGMNSFIHCEYGKMSKKNPGYLTLVIKIRLIKIRDLWPLCTCSAFIFLLCCKFQIISLKTVEVAKTWALYAMYRSHFYVNQGYVTLAIKILIKVLWPLCTCPGYILTLLQVSNHYFENCWGSCGDTNPNMPCV